MEIDNDHVVEWNSRAREEHEREVRSLKIVAHQDTLWGGGLNGEEFVIYVRRTHTLQVIAINNRHVCYAICEENRGKESKRSHSESFDVDDFYNLYHLGLTMKARRKKLQS